MLLCSTICHTINFILLVGVGKICILTAYYTRDHKAAAIPPKQIIANHREKFPTKITSSDFSLPFNRKKSFGENRHMLELVKGQGERQNFETKPLGSFTVRPAESCWNTYSQSCYRIFLVFRRISLSCPSHLRYISGQRVHRFALWTYLFRGRLFSQGFR